MTDSARAAALQVVNEILGPEMEEIYANAESGTQFGHELRVLALKNVFGSLWTRPGLGRRERSLVTLGILIASRAEGELKHHFRIAMRNGVTRDELEEVIYHSTAYAGFPAATGARAIAEEVLTS